MFTTALLFIAASQVYGQSCNADTLQVITQGRENRFGLDGQQVALNPAIPIQRICQKVDPSCAQKCQQATDAAVATGVKGFQDTDPAKLAAMQKLAADFNAALGSGAGSKSGASAANAKQGKAQGQKKGKKNKNKGKKNKKGKKNTGNGNGAKAANNNAGAAQAANNNAAAGGKFGSCSAPEIKFGLGFDGRTENSFESLGEFAHGSALNFKVIGDFVCGKLKDQCKAPAAANCDKATAAGIAAGKSQAAVDAFLGAL
ncbi:hypothetical protein HDV01_007520 [Terramyces sp. JEL0728]|nr:hypothetical protein HDV01_007520 [Terramyces sp. JEL0728]